MSNGASPIFFFDAAGVPASEVAGAIAEFWSVSVLVGGSEASKPITGRLLCKRLDDALDSLGFLLGVPHRSGGDGIYYLGGKSEKSIVALPSYGLSSAEVAQSLKSEAAVVGDKIFLDADQARVAQVRTLLQEFRTRPSLVLEITVLDVAESHTDRVNAWLDSFNAGVGYFARTYVPLGAAGEAADLALQTVKGPRYDVDISGALGLLDIDTNIRIEMREQVQVMSGSRVEFSSGEVVEDVTYVQQENTPSLVSQISRRTVGLVLRLRAVVSDDGSWHLNLELEDGSLVAGTERNTKWTGERFVHPDSGMVLLGSFTRKTTSMNRKGIPVLNQIPVIKPLFGKSVTNTINRQLMLLARPIVPEARNRASGAISRPIVLPGEPAAIP